MTYNVFDTILDQSHTLIAGCTGAGKSVTLNGIVYTILQRNPAQTQMVLMDPKIVELSWYKHTPHCLGYASDITEIIQLLQDCINRIQARYDYMESRQLRLYDGSDVYIIIDELADLMTVAKKQVAPLLQRITQIGRAAKYHCIIATQCALASVTLPTPIKINLDCRLGLRLQTSTDSRNVIGKTGCEALPKYGKGYLVSAGMLSLVTIPHIDESELKRMIQTVTSTPATTRTSTPATTRKHKKGTFKRLQESIDSMLYDSIPND